MNLIVYLSIQFIISTEPEQYAILSLERGMLLMLFGKMKVVTAHHTDSLCSYCRQSFEPGHDYCQFYYKAKPHGNLIGFSRNLHWWCVGFWLMEEARKRREAAGAREAKPRMPRPANKSYDPARQRLLNRRNYIRRKMVESDNLEVTALLLPEYEAITSELEPNLNKDTSSTPESAAKFHDLIKEAQSSRERARRLKTLRGFYNISEDISDDAVEQLFAGGSHEVREQEDAIQQVQD